MKRALPLLLASVALMAAPAHAADLGWNNGGGSAPVFSSTSAFNWSGFYAGVNGGFGWGTLERQATGGGSITKNNTGGWDLGAQAGYNMDMGGFVLGGEADLQWSSINHSDDLGSGNTLKSSIDSFGTIRARAGVTFDRVMPYVTGGFAVGRGSVAHTNNAGVVTSQSATHMGWALGGGLEAAATDNITLKAEYLYVDLGTQSYAGLPGGSVDATQRFSVVRAGLNFKF